MMSVYEIKRLSLMNIPGKLRELADYYERNVDSLGTAIVVMGHRDGTVSVRGYGERTDALQCTGWLHRALDVMTDGSTAEDETIAPQEGA